MFYNIFQVPLDGVENIENYCQKYNLMQDLWNTEAGSACKNDNHFSLKPLLRIFRIRAATE